MLNCKCPKKHADCPLLSIYLESSTAAPLSHLSSLSALMVWLCPLRSATVRLSSKPIFDVNSRVHIFFRIFGIHTNCWTCLYLPQNQAPSTVYIARYWICIAAHAPPNRNQGRPPSTLLGNHIHTTATCINETLLISCLSCLSCQYKILKAA